MTKTLQERFDGINVKHFCQQTGLPRRTIDKIKTEGYVPSRTTQTALHAALDGYKPPKVKK